MKNIEASGVIPVTYKDALIPMNLWTPSWTDPRFANARPGGVTIFVDSSVEVMDAEFNAQMVDGLTYLFDDRLEEPQLVGRTAMQAASVEAQRAVGNNMSARYVEHLLRAALNSPDLWVGHIKAGVKASGHPFKIFGYQQF